MAIHSGVVTPSSTATLVYQTPDGVETCLLVTAGPSAILGGADLTLANGFHIPAEDTATNPPGQMVRLDRFTGSLYAIDGSGNSVSYLAADIQ